MNVENRLATMRIAIHHHPVSILRNAVLSCNFLCGEKQFAENFNILRLHIIDRRYSVLRNDQHMQRCLRVEIPERQNIIILKYDIRRNLPRNNFKEKVI